MSTKIVNVFIDAEILLFRFCAAEAGCLNCTWLSEYCSTLNDLSRCLHLTVALLSLTVFSNVDVMTYTLPSFNSTDFRKPHSNKVRFIFYNSSKLRNTKVNAVMYPITLFCLSCPKTFLSCRKTLLNCRKTLLCCRKTLLSRHKTLPSCHKTLLSCRKTLPSCRKTLPSCRKHFLVVTKHFLVVAKHFLVVAKHFLVVTKHF